MTKNTLYITTLLICFFGYGWLFLLRSIPIIEPQYDFTVCVFKRITSLPCLTCGTSRSANHFFNGALSVSLLLNPLGAIVAAFMIVAPVWIVYDYSTKKQSFYTAFKKGSIACNNKKYVVSFFVLLIINWFWNIYKEV